MLSSSTVMEIHRLLAEGKLSQRKIAEVTGVSRGSVGAIARGRRTDRPRRESSDNKPWKPSGPPERCSTCGAMVYMPCRACNLRREKTWEITSPLGDEQTSDSTQLDLCCEHQQGYEEIHAKQKDAVPLRESILKHDLP